MTALKIILSSALITGIVLKGGPALAETAQAPVNVSIVQTADLDLNSEVGQRQLEHRITRAAYDVCGTASDADLKGKNDVRACRADVLAKARVPSTELASRSAPMKIAAGR